MPTSSTSARLRGSVAASRSSPRRSCGAGRCARAGWCSPTSGACTRARRRTLGGIAMFLGFLAALARRGATGGFDALSASTPSRSACARRRRASCRRSAPSTTSARSRRRPRSPAWCSAGVRAACVGVTCSTSASRSLGIVVLVGRPGAARHGALGDRHGQRHQPHRRARRPGRRHRRHRRRARSSSTASGSTTSACSPPTTSARSSPSSSLGICLGFLPHNFHPARIFMGDGGRAAARAADGGVARCSSAGQTDAAASPARPTSSSPRCSSRSSSSACRSSTRRSPSCGGHAHAQGVATADKGHLHHRLMRLGHGQRRSVLILWLVDGAALGVRALPDVHRQGRRHRADRHAALGLLLYTLFHPGRRQAREAEQARARRPTPRCPCRARVYPPLTKGCRRRSP